MGNIEIEIPNEESLEAEVLDLNYIPDYQVYEQQRQANEVVRQQNETTRQTQEGTRVLQESGRVSAEGLRVSAEKDRVDAEALREDNEDTRKKNEEDRQEAEAVREATMATLAEVAFSGSYLDLLDTPIIPDELADLSGDSTHRLVTDTEKSTWNGKSNFSGSYNDLTNKPTIPTKTSDLNNDSGYITKSVDDLTNYYDKTATDTSLSGKQATLVSGTNIKTINNESLLGSGNITISGGTSTDVQINSTSITSSGTANIAAEGTYNSSTNKLVCKSYVDNIVGNIETLLEAI